MARILVADSDPHGSNYLREVLVEERFGEIETVGDGKEALEHLCTGVYDLAILEMYMPRVGGLEALQAIRQKGIQTDIVILCRNAAVEDVVQALKTGAQDFLKKPVHTSSIIDAVGRLLEKQHPSPHYLADRLNKYLREHATQCSLKLNDLCRHFKISRGYVTRLFQKHIGATFTQCLISYRVEKAKDLLESTDDPIYLIAEQCGFKNSRRLAETFRKLEGISPIKYRQRGGE